MNAMRSQLAEYINSQCQSGHKIQIPCAWKGNLSVTWSPELAKGAYLSSFQRFETGILTH